MRIIETKSAFDHGSNLDIDTVAEVLTSLDFQAQKGVLVRADPDNAGIIYVGNSDVTAGTAAATDGIPLAAGDAVLIEIDNPNKIYVIGSVENQKAYFVVV